MDGIILVAVLILIKSIVITQIEISIQFLKNSKGNVYKKITCLRNK